MKRAAVGLAALAVAGGIYLALPEDKPHEQPAEAPLVSPTPAAEILSPTPAATAALETWSDTEPAVNQIHIFTGEINRRGKPVGFHSRPGGHDPEGARLVGVVDGPNRAGVYIADVEIRDDHGNWKRKRSTCYPDRLSREQVVAAVVHAWKKRQTFPQGKFRGPSGEGFTIEGYTLDDRVNTAYPLYDEGQ
jgi:hypothetical protein